MSEEEPTREELLAGLRASTDQAIAATGELAATAWAFYSSLVEQGFTPDQAMTLVLGWLQAMLYASD